MWYRDNVRRMTDSNIEVASVKAVGEMLSTFLLNTIDKKAQVSLVAGTTQLRETMRMNKQIVFPQVALIVETHERDTNRYNPTALRNGIRLGKSPDGKFTYKASLVPLTIGLRVLIMIRDYSDMQKIATKWLKESRTWTVILDGDGFHLGIKAELSTQNNFPEQDLADVGNLFTFQAGIILSTYSGDVYKETNITKLKVDMSLVNTGAKTVELVSTVEGDVSNK